jgi:hypothetical protein
MRATALRASQARRINGPQLLETAFHEPNTMDALWQFRVCFGAILEKEMRKIEASCRS